MKIVINKSAQAFELSQENAFKALAEVFSKLHEVEKSAAELLAHVEAAAAVRDKTTFSFRRIDGKEFPLAFNCKREDGAFSVDSATIAGDTDFAKAFIAKMKEQETYAQKAKAMLSSSAKAVKNKAVAGYERSKDIAASGYNQSKKAAANFASFAIRSLPHAIVGGLAYLGRNSIVRAFVGVVPAVLLSPVAIVLSAVGLSVAADAVRAYIKRSNLADYRAKEQAEIDLIPLNQSKAFMDGVEAQQSYTAYFKSFVAKNDYRHGNAFMAGMSAQENNEVGLIANIATRRDSFAV